jgi:hypothetical protein
MSEGADFVGRTPETAPHIETRYNIFERLFTPRDFDCETREDFNTKAFMQGICTDAED